jgi:hypothetical protein
MRTTIEIKPEHRAKLLELAARRGEKGFSSVIGEAIDAYLESAVESERLRNRALRLRGKLSAEAAERLENETRRIREFWR